MKILAFDLATNTGCAIGDADGRPICHSERLGPSGSKHGALLAQAFRMTKRLILQHKPDTVVVEEPIASGVQGAKQRVQLAMGYRGAVFAVCHMHDIPCFEYPVQSIRKHFIGRGDLKRDAAKARTMERCTRLGWHIANDNEADACAVWDFTRAKLVGRSTIGGGLFDGRDP